MVLVDFVVFVAAVVVVVAIVQRNRHVVRLRTRPYRCRRCATQPACCALAHEASSSDTRRSLSPIVVVVVAVA